MSNYSRGKRRYNHNGYNGSYRRGRGRGRHNKNTDYYNNTNNNPTNNSQHFNDSNTDNTNKPFRILQRKQDTNNPNNPNLSSPNIHHSPTNNPPPRFANPNPSNNPPLNNESNVAAVLQNVIDPNPNNSNSNSNNNSKSTTLGHQLLSMQKRGQRLYKYKRKDGTGSAIPIPAHHKKNYNKSIGRGKKFDKEREAALQAIAAQNTEKGSEDNNGKEDVITSDSGTGATGTGAGAGTSDVSGGVLDDNASPERVDVIRDNNQREERPHNNHPPPPSLDNRSWRRGGDRGGGGFRNRSRGRGRRGRGKKYNNHYYNSNRHRNFGVDKWSDEEDYNRDRYGNNKGNRWDKRRSKFEPPRHRNQHGHEWDKHNKNHNNINDNNNNNNNHAFGSNLIHGHGHGHSHTHDKNPIGLHDRNIGPRAQRYNNSHKFNNTNTSINSQPIPPQKPPTPTTPKNVIFHKWESNYTNKTAPEDITELMAMDEPHTNTNMDLENDILSQYLNTINSSDCASYKCIPFLDVRMCGHVLSEIESHLTDCSDFLVIGVIGPQSVGKSTILSYLAGGEMDMDNNNNIFLPSSLQSLISSLHTTHGIQCYISPERVIYLDCQPILSPSILFSLTNHRRRCMREKKQLLTPMETWDIEMIKHSLFLSCICHILLVVSDNICDLETINFMKSVYALRQSMKINSFLRHDSSLRKKLKDLQMKINEKYDKKLKKKKKEIGSSGSGGIRPQVTHRTHGHGQKQQWIRHDSKNKNNNSSNMSDNGILNEEDALFYGIDSSVEEDYKLFKLLNAQQRYGFPDVIFIQNKVNMNDMCGHRFTLQKKLLYTMFKHEYFIKEGEIGNSELIGCDNGNGVGIVNEVSIKIPSDVKENDKDDTSDSDGGGGSDSNNKDEYIIEQSKKMNLYFLPRIENEMNKLKFENGCIELRNQIMSMGKPLTISQSHSYKQTERDWFSFSKKIWHVIANAPNFIEYRGNHNRTNT